MSPAPDDEPFAELGGYPHEGDPRRVLFHATPVPTVVVDLTTQLVAANEAFQRLFGLTSGRLTVSELAAFTEPEDRERRNENFQRVSSGFTVDMDKRYRRRDGSVFWGHLTVSPLYGDDGVQWGVIGAVADVTDRIDARSALTESEQRFRALVQNTTDAIVVLDAEGRLVYASPSGERLTGNRTEDVVGSDIFQYVHPDDRTVVALSFASIFEPGDDDDPNVPLQFRVVHNDGTVRFVEAISTNLLDEPAVNGVVVNIRDLTDTAVAASALELTESRFRRMIENISDTITLLDPDGRVVQSTGNVRPILGYPVEFWEGASAFELVHPDDQERVVTAFRDLCETPGADMVGEMRVRTAGGDWIDADIYAVNLLDDPDVAAVVLTTRNISERKRAERELNEARDQAIQALEMRTEFIASVSHELRSPIHGLLGLSELLASATLDDDARQLAQSIGRATETLRMVLDDILDYSKIEVGRLEIDPAPLLVSEVADDVLALFGPEARAKGISLVVEAESGFPRRVRADGLRVRQVLTNLVANAVKFTTSGEVRVRAASEPVGPDGLARVRIEVSDTGIGIPSDAYARLFQPFSQAQPSTAREFGGTGLGLSIAKRLVELMGGELGFESVPTQGSTFWFVLPVEVLDPPPVDERPPDAARDRPPAPGTRVMVVEDNQINQLLVRRQLERLGYEAEVFESGAAAIANFAEVGAAVVLMDWQLPGIDGLETTRRLRAIERDLGLDRTPIVAITASALPGDRARCLAAGMDDFIAKPVSMRLLGEVIRRWTAERAVPGVGGRPRPAAGAGAGRAVLPDPRAGRRTGTWPTAATAATERPAGSAERGAEGDHDAIDVPVLDRLVEDLSDPQLVASVVRTYLRELPARVDGIEAAGREQDEAGLDAAAHLLRSTSAAVGATRLAELCRTIESGAGPVTAEALGAVRAESGLVHAALTDQLERLVDPQRPAGTAAGGARST